MIALGVLVLVLGVLGLLFVVVTVAVIVLAMIFRKQLTGLWLLLRLLWRLLPHVEALLPSPKTLAKALDQAAVAAVIAGYVTDQAATRITVVC